MKLFTYFWFVDEHWTCPCRVQPTRCTSTPPCHSAWFSWWWVRTSSPPPCGWVDRNLPGSGTDRWPSTWPPAAPRPGGERRPYRRTWLALPPPPPHSAAVQRSLHCRLRRYIKNNYLPIAKIFAHYIFYYFSYIKNKVFQRSLHWQLRIHKKKHTQKKQQQLFSYWENFNLLHFHYFILYKTKKRSHVSDHTT